MGLFGAIASVANSFQLVPPGTQSAPDAAPTPAPLDTPVALLASLATPPPAPLTGPLRAQASEISARQCATSVRESYFSELGTLFAPTEGAPGLSTDFMAFAKSWRDLAATPRDPALAQQVIQRGQALAGTVRRLSGGVESLASLIGNDVTTGLQDLNQTLVAIYRENRTIATSAALKRPSEDEEARRDTLISKIVDMTGANVFPRENRGIALYTATGQPLLDGRPTQFTSTAATSPPPPGAVSADGRIGDGRLGALLRLAADGSRAVPPRPADPAPDAEIIRKLRSQLDVVTNTALGRTRPKQPTSFSDAYDMAMVGRGPELGFGFFVGANRQTLDVNPELVSGTKTLKPDAATAAATSLNAGGRLLTADGLSLTNSSYGQFATTMSDHWNWLSGAATRDAKVADVAGTLMDATRAKGTAIDIPSEVSALTTVQDALSSTRRIGLALGDFLRVLDQIAA